MDNPYQSPLESNTRDVPDSLPSANSSDDFRWIVASIFATLVAMGLLGALLIVVLCIAVYLFELPIDF